MYTYISKTRFGTLLAFSAFVLIGLQNGAFAQISAASDSKAEPKLAIVLNSGEAKLSRLSLSVKSLIT
jgi:hypothetical protein